MAGESDFGAPLSTARVGNPLLYARRVFVCIISSFFSSKDLNTFPGSPDNAYQILYNEDGSISDNSPLFISDRFSEDQVSRRPQIVIGRGAGSWGDVAIGDQGQGVGGGAWGGETDKTDYFSIPIEISVYSQNDIEAENIAWAIAFCIKAYEREIRFKSLIFKIESTAIGPALPDKISASYEQFKLGLDTRVTIGLAWKKSSTLASEQLQQSLCKIDGMGTSIIVGDLCVFAKPKDPPETWT